MSSASFVGALIDNLLAVDVQSQTDSADSDTEQSHDDEEMLDEERNHTSSPSSNDSDPRVVEALTRALKTLVSSSSSSSQPAEDEDKHAAGTPDVDDDTSLDLSPVTPTQATTLSHHEPEPSSAQHNDAQRRQKREEKHGQQAAATAADDESSSVNNNAAVKLPKRQSTRQRQRSLQKRRHRAQHAEGHDSDGSQQDTDTEMAEEASDVTAESSHEQIPHQHQHHGAFSTLKSFAHDAWNKLHIPSPLTLRRQRPSHEASSNEDGHSDTSSSLSPRHHGDHDSISPTARSDETTSTLTAPNPSSASSAESSRAPSIIDLTIGGPSKHGDRLIHKCHLQFSHVMDSMEDKLFLELSPKSLRRRQHFIADLKRNRERFNAEADDTLAGLGRGCTAWGTTDVKSMTSDPHVRREVDSLIARMHAIETSQLQALEAYDIACYAKHCKKETRRFRRDWLAGHRSRKSLHRTSLRKAKANSKADTSDTPGKQKASIHHNECNKDDGRTEQSGETSSSYSRQASSSSKRPSLEEVPLSKKQFEEAEKGLLEEASTVIRRRLQDKLEEIRSHYKSLQKTIDMYYKTNADSSSVLSALSEVAADEASVAEHHDRAPQPADAQTGVKAAKQGQSSPGGARRKWRPHRKAEQHRVPATLVSQQ